MSFHRVHLSPLVWYRIMFTFEQFCELKSWSKTVHEKVISFAWVTCCLNIKRKPYFISESMKIEGKQFSRLSFGNTLEKMEVLPISQPKYGMKNSSTAGKSAIVCLFTMSTYHPLCGYRIVFTFEQFRELKSCSKTVHEKVISFAWVTGCLSNH